MSTSKAFKISRKTILQKMHPGVMLQPEGRETLVGGQTFTVRRGAYIHVAAVFGEAQVRIVGRVAPARGLIRRHTEDAATRWIGRARRIEA